MDKDNKILKVGDICYYHDSFCAITGIKKEGNFDVYNVMYQNGHSGVIYVSDQTEYEYRPHPVGHTARKQVLLLLAEIKHASMKHYPELIHLYNYFRDGIE